MGYLRDYLSSYYQAFDGNTCEVTPITVAQMGQSLSICQDLLPKAAGELGLRTDEIDIYTCAEPELEDHDARQAWTQGRIRGVFFQRDGRYIILLNPRTATSNTMLHELKHVEQRKFHMIRTKKGYEANAQRWADARESDYATLVMR
jgi:hypothetical protein